MAFQYEIYANNDADMQTTLNTLSMAQQAGFRNQIRYAVDYYGTKFTWDGVTMVKDDHGLDIKQWVAQPGVYANVLWVAASALSSPFPPVGLTFPAGVTVTALPANSNRKFS